MRISTPIERRFSQPLESISNIIRQAETLPISDLANYLNSIDQWRYGKTDLLYWVAVLDRFDDLLGQIITEAQLDTLQSRAIPESDRFLARSILRFQKLLIENSSNKSIFNGFDRIDALIYAFELDVANEALALAAFFASKIHIQRSIRTSMNEMHLDDLLGLVERVNRPVTHFIYTEESTRVPKRVSLSRLLKKGVFVIDKVIPKGDQRKFAHTRRMYLGDPEDLAVSRLLSSAVLVYCRPGAMAIDADFIARDLHDLLDLVCTAADKVKEAALVMLDALFRMRLRHAAVVAAMGAHLHDGFVMSRLREAVEGHMSEIVASAFFNLLISFFASSTGASALFAAGIVQYVCAAWQRPDVPLRTKGRLVMGANTFLFTIAATLPRFLAEHGMSILAKELALAVDLILQVSNGMGGVGIGDSENQNQSENQN
ncbi:hypothetical protein NEHOM01_2406, partial [Nematocida homosporus]|uniref:uncharacterized protein n=1 Tax=Nematocida homosporus TaxID=1912981 RepID=UPI00221F293F